MKFLKNIINKNKPLFEKGGKFEKYSPLFGTISTFLFLPAHKTPDKGCHIKDGIDLKRVMITVIISLLPVTIFGIWNVGYQHHLSTTLLPEISEQFLYGLSVVLPIILVSYASGLAIEFIFAFKKGHDLHEGYLVSGLLIPLTLPPEIPLWMVAVASAFAVFIGKEVFGGTGMNILNVALTARAFLFFAYPGDMTGDNIWVSLNNEQVVDGYTGATLLGQAMANPTSISIENMVDVHGFKFDNILYDAFMGFIPGSIGETSTFLCLLGGLYLIITGIGSWRIMLSVFAGGYIMSLIFNIFAVNQYMELNPLLQLCLGSFAFGAVFMATDPVTAAQTNRGKIIYGLLIGMFAILIRVFNPAYPEGTMLSILFMNIMAPYIDHFVVQSNINKRLKRLKIKTV